MLKNYYLLKGIIEKDLEDHTRRRSTHHNLIVKAEEKEYQVNIDIQSRTYPNVKVYCNDKIDYSLLERIKKLPEQGLFNLNEWPQEDRLDYIRGNMLPINQLIALEPKPKEAISDLLDQYVKPGCLIYVIGEFYSDAYEYEEDNLPHGLQLRKMYDHLPPRGVHDIHLNQGDPLSLSQHTANGIYQDGGLFVQTNDKQSKNFFFLFQEQSLHTDENGNPI